MSRLRPLALVLLLLPLPGCIVTGTLDPNGGARLTLKLRLVSIAHFEPMKQGLQGPAVRLTSASMTPKKWATFELACDDVRKLPTVPVLSQAKVDLREEEPGTRTLAVVIANNAEEPASEAFQRYLGGELRVALELPGDVVRTNAGATGGRTVTWTWPIAAVSTQKKLDLAATFRSPAHRSADVPELERHARGREVVEVALGRDLLDQVELHATP
ncbi:MAG TPA: hypothetical protein VKA21_04515 [Candidatus Binatia bacterium]|nr:hypothetical protein [Candidatus Binatia bacterium]